LISLYPLRSFSPPDFINAIFVPIIIFNIFSDNMEKMILVLLAEIQIFELIQFSEFNNLNSTQIYSFFYISLPD